jgi:hypothetical protein
MTSDHNGKPTVSSNICHQEICNVFGTISNQADDGEYIELNDI